MFLVSHPCSFAARFEVALVLFHISKNSQKQNPRPNSVRTNRGSEPIPNRQGGSPVYVMTCRERGLDVNTGLFAQALLRQLTVSLHKTRAESLSASNRIEELCYRVKKILDTDDLNGSNLLPRFASLWSQKNSNDAIEGTSQKLVFSSPWRIARSSRASIP